MHPFTGLREGKELKRILEIHLPILIPKYNFTGKYIRLLLQKKKGFSPDINSNQAPYCLFRGSENLKNQNRQTDKK